MEYLGATSEFDWNVVDESELMMAQLLGTYQDQDPSAGIESMFQPHHGSSSSDWLYNFASSLFSPIIETASPSSFFFPSNEFNICELSDPNMIPTAETSLESMNICLQVDCNDQFVVANNNPLEDYSVNPSGPIELAVDTPLPKRKVVESGIGNEDEILRENPKKKVQKTAKNARTKKEQKSVGNEDKEESNASYCSEDNSNASQELNADGDDTITIAKGKTRAGRGSATDPQSLYARKRRERINERLRILQTLVPNGTKVDISTMLDEAVQYVKFLQLQIKLLSSDDMWMYAPLAYNGMDIGLDLKIPFPPQRH